MSDWALDPTTGDIALPAGRVALATGDDAIAQDWGLRLGCMLGEWFRDRSTGVDLDVVLGKLTPGRRLAIRAIVRAETLAVRGLVAVQGIAFRLNSATRELDIDVEAIKDSGAVVPLQASVGIPEAA